MKVFCSFLLLLICNFSFAQPSTAQVKSVIRNHCVKDPSSLLSISVSDGGTRKEFEGGQYVYYHSRGYTMTFKTPYSGVKYISEGTLMMKNKGGGYRYDGHSAGKRYYTGIPDPDVAEIEAAMNEQEVLDAFIPNKYAIRIDGKIKVSEETSWYWTGYNIVQFKCTFNYTTYGGSNFKHWEGSSLVKLKRSKDGDSFNPDEGLLLDGKWLNPTEIVSCEILDYQCYFNNEFEKEKVSESTVPADQKGKIKTLYEQKSHKLAEKMLAKLPKIEIPDFKYENQAKQFVHELLYEGDTNKIKACVYAMIPRTEHEYKYTEEWSPIVLTQYGEDLLSKALHNIDLYKHKFCKYPVHRRKKDTYGYMGKPFFWDKLMDQTLDIMVYEKDGKWYLKDLRFSLPADNMDRYINAEEEQCGAPSFFLSEDEAAFKIGDRVKSQVDGRSYFSQGVVTEILLETGSYKVKFGEGRNAYSRKIPGDLVFEDTEYQEEPAEEAQEDVEANDAEESEEEEGEGRKKRRGVRIKKPRINLGIGG